MKSAYELAMERLQKGAPSLSLTEEQKKTADALIREMEASHIWPGPIVTEVVPASDFWEAEKEHQAYLQKHPYGYSDANDYYQVGLYNNKLVFQKWYSKGNGGKLDSTVYRFSYDASGNLISCPGKFTAIVGARDLIIVETPDALLVCRRDRAQDVGKVVKWLEEQRRKELL